jgi:hypothetical protein
MKKIITIEDILKHKPCDTYNTREKIIKETDNNWPKTAQELVSLPIPARDICWVFLRPGLVFDNTTLGHISCDIAESVLHFYESRYPNNSRPRDAIITKRQWLDGLIGDKELYAAAYAAYDAAYAAVYDAAVYAAYAAYDAVAYVAYATACDAAAAYAAACDGAYGGAVAATHAAASVTTQWGKNLEIIKSYIG